MPAWARGPRPAPNRPPGLDLRDLSGRVLAADVVRRAARNVSPLAVTRPSAWMLREALAGVHGVAVDQIFPRPSLPHLLAPILTALVGPGDHVAIAAPIRPEFPHQVLSVGAHHVDIGRDQAWTLQPEAFERLLGDGRVSAVIFGRPALPTGIPASLALVRQALDAGLLVLVDETALAYADLNAGLPRPTPPTSDTALTLLADEATSTERLIVLRSIPGLGGAELVYAVAEAELAARLWQIDPASHIPAPVAAGAWIALDHVGHARRVIAARCTLRAEMSAAIQALEGYAVAAPGGPCLFVQRPGVDGQTLKDALAVGGLLVAHSTHHTWRDGVALGLPTDTVLGRVVAAFEHAAQALPD